MPTDAEAAPLSSTAIQGLLRTQMLGRSLHVYDEVDSTNRTALSLAAAGAPSGTVVIAETQTAGRGRLGRVWHSPPGENLYCSMLLRVTLPSDLFSIWLSWLPLVTGVGVLKAIQRATGVEATLKWPNDVLIGVRKVAGILCESTGFGTPMACVVVGIGINVNMHRERFPPEIAERATSLVSEAGRLFSRTDLVTTLLNDLESRFDSIASAIPQSVVHEYASLCSTLGRQVRITLASGEIFEGVAQVLTPEGALKVIQCAMDRTRVVYAGDVVHVR